jgi:hypothetical protein
MTTPVYNAKIPQPENSIDESQTDFLNNFSTLFNAFGNDHVPLNAALDAGNHTFVRLVEQNVGQATGTSEIAIYSKLIPEQTDQIFYRTIGNGLEVQYSNFQIYPIQPIKHGDVIVQIPYFTFLPGGMIMYFGTVVLDSNPFQLMLEPAICTNIFGINLGARDVPIRFPSAATPVPNQDGKYQVVNLSFTDFVAKDQSYIIYGVL